VHDERRARKQRSTFETASGTTNVEIRKSSAISKQLIIIIATIAILALLVIFFLFGS
jgi:hypothetical protein